MQLASWYGSYRLKTQAADGWDMLPHGIVGPINSSSSSSSHDAATTTQVTCMCGCSYLQLAEQYSWLAEEFKLLQHSQ
jgi:hypothetical protein